MQKNLRMKFKETDEIWHIYSSLAGTQRYKRGFVKKTRAIKLKVQEELMISTSLLMFSPEFSL